MLDLLAPLPQIKEADRRRIVFDEAYYHTYGLMTQAESNHPFSSVLALESENIQEHSLIRSRIERYFDLDIGLHGISLNELFSLPREIVEEVFRKATDLKAKKTKANAGLANDLEAELRRNGG